jgi:hypothetical protein
VSGSGKSTSFGKGCSCRNRREPRPFADRSLFGVGAAHLADEPPDPPAPPEVSWTLLRALEKDPAARPPTSTTYAHLLFAAARRE